LLENRETLEDFHNGEYDAPVYVKEGGNLSRCLLDAWLELLGTLRIPVVVVFDQLEDYLRAPTPEQETTNLKFFTQAIASFIDKVSGVCVLAFAATNVWADLVSNASDYAQSRLNQSFALPGKASQNSIKMPDRVEGAVLEELIRSRIRSGFDDLDLTGLPPAFPFNSEDLGKLAKERSIRECIRKLGMRYDQIVYPDPIDLKKILGRLQERLDTIWAEQVAIVRAKYGTELPTSTTLIPDFQGALEGWLQALLKEPMTGVSPWAKVEVVTCPTRQQYGYLTVVRTDGPNQPGVGIAAWLGHRAPKLNNLVKILEYFTDNPCPIRTLVFLRADGEAALDGRSGEVFAKARTSRDVRVVQYDETFFHTLMAFTGWYQAVLPEVEAIQNSKPEAKALFREFLEEVSKPLIAWIDAWRQPAKAKGI
jgi:hypothetical protein